MRLRKRVGVFFVSFIRFGLEIHLEAAQAVDGIDAGEHVLAAAGGACYKSGFKFKFDFELVHNEALALALVAAELAGTRVNFLMDTLPTSFSNNV